MDETTPLSGDTGAGRRILAERYVLQGLLGQGGMADVELAYDQLLDRQVAVKILHQRYASDPSFIARFRREAQAAASLNHPNVVAVYDTGEHDARPYIVMEYVAGRSLKELLHTQGVLPERAAEIAGDAALALHYSHERNLVHRDVKPANIMISDEGQVKVADFGIARAVDAESVTQTAAVFGTAAYVSPEQAQGETVDRRSDIYSLGCVLYELLTGRQPFAAESAVALAYKHVTEDPIPPTQLNPEIPATLEAVTMKALAKDAGARYQTAREFSADLQRAVHGMAVSAPPVLMYQRTQQLGAPAERTAVLPPPTYADEPWPDERPRRRAAGWAVLTLIVLAAFVAGGFLLANLLGGQPNQRQVPDVVGMGIVDAQNRLIEQGFQPRLLDQQPHPDLPPNSVISTDPAPLSMAAEGSEVRIVYSSGPQLVQVPELAGMPEADAQRQLRDDGFSIGARESEHSDEVERGRVIRTDPPGGQEVPERTPVSLVVSDGPAAFTLPNVVNMTEEAARETLRDFCGTPPCVNILRIQEFHASVPENRVIRQDPGAGAEVQRGATVTIVVSRGPEASPSPSPSPSPTETTPPPTEPDPDPTPTETNGILRND